MSNESDLQQPESWVKTRLGEIAEIILGQSPPSSTYNVNGKGLPFYQGKLEFGKMYPTPQKWCTEPRKVAEKGDVLISVRAPVGPTNISPGKSCIGRGLAGVRGLGGIDTFFILYLLRRYEKVIAGKGTGTTFSAISGGQLRDLEIPLPPLNEQRRIVGKVELLFSFLDAGVAQLRLVQGQLKRYRQAVLKAAFEGKLTQQWRETNTEKIEPVTKLIELIKEERKKKLRSKYRERPLVKIENLPKLPEGWLWTNCENLSYFVTSGSRDWKKYYSSKGPIFIRTQNINTNELNLDDVAHVKIPARAEGKRSLVKKNDILVIITGANVGKVALVDRDMDEAYVSQSVALIKLAMPKIGRFVQLSMITDGVGKTHLNKMVYGMGRPVLSLEDIRDVMVPIAPLAEQEQIVNKIKQKFSELTNLERVIQNNIQKSRFMRHSILKTAFEGKLIPQNLSDEPAEKLLERIKTERLNNKSKTKSQMELSKYVK